MRLRDVFISEHRTAVITFLGPTKIRSCAFWAVHVDTSTGQYSCLRAGVRQLAPVRNRVSRTDLVQVGRKADCALMGDAGNGPQVFVDSADVIVRHVAVGRTRHDLKEIGVEGRRKDTTLRT